MLLLLVLHLLWNALNNAPSNRAPSSLSRSAYSTIGNDSFSTVSHSHSLSRYYCCRCAVYSASFAFAGTRTQDLFSHLYVCRGGRRERTRAESSRVCKFFSKNSLRDNGFSMSHTSLPTSTSLPRHDNFSNIPSPRTPAAPLNSDNYLHSLPASPVPLCFWGMIDGKSQ